MAHTAGVFRVAIVSLALVCSVSALRGFGGIVSFAKRASHVGRGISFAGYSAKPDYARYGASSLSSGDSQLDSGVGSLLTTPPEGTVGRFTDITTKDMSFISCNVFALAQVKGVEYGVGFPEDIPVMLTYLEDKQLKPVHPDYPDYEHLLNHVSVQLGGDDLFLIPTPVVLTLQGEFEDEELNNSNPFSRSEESDSSSNSPLASSAALSHSDEDGFNDLMEDLEYLDSGNFDDEDYDNDDDDNEVKDEDEEDDNNMVYNVGSGDGDRIESDPDPLQEWLDSSPSSGVTVHRPSLHHNIDTMDIPEDAIVTEEDTAKLQMEHRRVDLMISHAVDMKLIGSFHYKKKNFHLVRLLEPIFVIGKRLDDRKGWNFALLDEQQTEEVRPTLEHLLLNGSPSQEQESTRTGSKIVNKGTQSDLASGFRNPSHASKSMIGMKRRKYSSGASDSGSGSSFERAKRKWEQLRSTEAQE